MAAIDDIDTAKVDACPGGCGALVRRFDALYMSTPSRAAPPAGPWYCPSCIQARTVAAIPPHLRGLRAIRPERPQH